MTIKSLLPALILQSILLQANAQALLDTSTYLKNSPNIYAILLAKNDQVVYRKYFNQHSESDLYNDQSLTKSIMSLLIGIAIDKGFIHSVDEPVVDFLPVLKGDTDKRKQAITLRQVMNQASGFCHEDLERLGGYLQLPDPSGYVLSCPLLSDPGKVFHYNNAASHLLSVILTKATGMDSRSFAAKYLFAPLGITGFDWMKMRDGYYDGCGLLSIRLRAADMLKIGLLVLNKGRYNNTPVISEKWINELSHPSVFYDTEWGFPQSTYALCWYHAGYKGTAILYGMGWGGQFLVVIPALRAVAIINENTDDRTAVMQSVNFVRQLFPVIMEQLKR